MIGRDWTVGTYHFYDTNEYQAALRDQKLINSIQNTYNLLDSHDVDKLYMDISKGKFHFETIIGRDFDDEIYEKRKQLREQKQNEELNKKQGSKKKKENVLSLSKEKNKVHKKKANHSEKENEKNRKAEQKQIAIQNKLLANFKKINRNNEGALKKFEEYDKKMQQAILAELRKRERRRKLMIVMCSVISVGCITYFAYYLRTAGNSNKQFEDLASLKDNTFTFSEKYQSGIKVNKTNSKDIVVPDVLSDYKTLYSKNKKLIGWIKIADTVIDYPVMQTTDNEYYLKHNFNQEEDRNGCIFMDYQCDVISRSTNLILYGHHMQSGNMFGSLYKYQDEDYGKEHKTIKFDTIYEKGTYEVMYVFRSRVYSEEDVSFKYYQFINANSAKEFKSYMNEMAKISFYDTGVTASYGDQLLTLSTCDYEESDGRFVVVCKRVK